MLTVPTFLILTFFCCLSALITSLYFAATSFGLEGIADGAPALLSAGFEVSPPSETGAGAVVLSDGAGAFVSDGAGEGRSAPLQLLGATGCERVATLSRSPGVVLTKA